ncbi:hypothetical protein HY374_02905 [Candidatus Berkelbacteria bacterium]|nr:hypothetical protein [Candidatus Berkelbacteria bacterium]
MQQIATKVFIAASVAFGIVGILMVLTGSNDNEPLGKALTIIVFIILPSFALSIAGKYLNGKS